MMVMLPRYKVLLGILSRMDVLMLIKGDPLPTMKWCFLERSTSDTNNEWIYMNDGLRNQ